MYKKSINSKGYYKNKIKMEHLDCGVSEDYDTSKVGQAIMTLFMLIKVLLCSEIRLNFNQVTEPKKTSGLKILLSYYNSCCSGMWTHFLRRTRFR